jgi:PadR family transcriptional regulator, regulatory protein PadR
MSTRRLSFAALAILKAVADGVRYGFDIMDRTTLPSGTVYPALSRLERDGLLKSNWEDLEKAHGDRRPPRRYYRITPHGERALTGALERLQVAKPPRGLSVPRPARSKA